MKLSDKIEFSIGEYILLMFIIGIIVGLIGCTNLTTGSGEVLPHPTWYWSKEAKAQRAAQKPVGHRYDCPVDHSLLEKIDSHYVTNPDGSKSEVSEWKCTNMNCRKIYTFKEPVAFK